MSRRRKVYKKRRPVCLIYELQIRIGTFAFDFRIYIFLDFATNKVREVGRGYRDN